MAHDTSVLTGKSDTEPAVIKKYANRRLYNTDTSTYVTLDNLADMVRSERDFVVYDAKTGEDLTHQVLTQIIVDEESKGQSLLPISFLRQLIRFYGNSMEKLVPSYLELSMNTLTREQEKYTRQLADTFGTANFGAAALEAMQKQARQTWKCSSRHSTCSGPSARARPRQPKSRRRAKMRLLITRPAPAARRHPKRWLNFARNSPICRPVWKRSPARMTTQAAAHPDGALPTN